MFLRRPAALLPAALMAVLILSACGGSTAQDAQEPETETLSVVVGFYPLQFLVESIAGDAAEVTLLATPGVDAHDLELTARQVIAINEADLVVTIPGFQPAVDDAVASLPSERVLDLTTGLNLLMRDTDEHADDHADEPGDEHGDEPADEHGGADGGADGEDHADSPEDPHVWLDPMLMAQMSQTLSERLSALLDDSSLQANTADLRERLAALDSEWRTGTTTCRSRDLVVSHEAFGYLAAAYDFAQRGISGLTPDSEPTPTTVRRIADFVRANDVRTIYYETLVDPRVAQTIANETGATTAVLDPLEGVEQGSNEDYFSVMRANLATIIAGQGCS
jgi:zinc transport system substrate-binding protein